MQPANDYPRSLLRGNTAIVTGGSSGIGLEIAAEFLLEGCSILMVGRDRGRLDSARSSLLALVPNDAEVRIEVLALDLTQLGSGRAVVDTAISALGGIDILVNNVGGLVVQNIDEASSLDCVQSLQLNLVTAVDCSNAAIPEFRKRSGGVIINICSVSAHRGNGSTGFYPVAKAALRAYTVSLAGRLAGDRIRVNSISPGPIDTPVWDRLGADNAGAWREAMANRVPMGCLGRPEQVAKAAVFLASSLSEWTTGMDFVIDGGMLAV